MQTELVLLEEETCNNFKAKYVFITMKNKSPGKLLSPFSLRVGHGELIHRTCYFSKKRFRV
jgi:hypothetical protein